MALSHTEVKILVSFVLFLEFRVNHDLKGPQRAWVEIEGFNCLEKVIKPLEKNILGFISPLQDKQARNSKLCSTFKISQQINKEKCHVQRNFKTAKQSNSGPPVLLLTARLIPR